MAAPLIEVEGVCRRFALGGRAIAALEDVSLSVGQGEYVGVVGPSGSGKTTLMKILGCLDLPDAGRYRLDGAEVTALEQDRLAAIRNRTVGFVFQSFVLLPQSTALENVELPLAYAGMRRGDRRGRAREMLARVGLSHRLAHRPARLSGGEQQRVAIARAMVNRPKLLLADEPTGALDAASADGVMRLFGELNGSGVTVIVVTHDPAVAARAGRVLHLRNGRVVRQERTAA